MSPPPAPALSPEAVLRFEEADWSRVSDRIHDDILQTLGCSLLKAELCKALLARGSTVQAEHAVDELRDQLGAVVEDLRSLMTHIRPYRDHPLGLRGSLESYLRGYQTSGTSLGYRVEITVEPAPEMAVLLFRLLREALAEMIDYRRFSYVDVRVQGDAGRAALALVATEPRRSETAAPALVEGRDLGWRARFVGGESTVRDLGDRLEWTIEIPARCT